MNNRTGRVLILDDDVEVGSTTILMVRHLQMEAMAVTDTAQFHHFVSQWEPTHIILDLVMPETDGIEVLQQLSQIRCKARIAITSGVGSRVLSAARQSAAEHGLFVAASLPKPLTLSALQEFLFADDLLQSRPPAKAVSDGQSKLNITDSELEEAIAEKQFRIVFQPKIDSATMVLKGFETLVRWEHPKKGLIMPDQFIPLSEHLGLIGPITTQIVNQAFKWYAGNAPLSGLSLSINISAKTLASHDFPDELQYMCRQGSILPNRVILEVTETAAMDDQLLALDMFTRLRMKGFHVSIDDFGIGHSSLALLARFPFSELKVDRQFGMTAGKSRESKAIIQSTVDLGHRLDLCVVAEGVEDLETLEFLASIGCDQAQGYYIARPMAGHGVVDWIKKRQESNFEACQA